MDATERRVFFVAQARSGEYVTDEGRLTWARAFAYRFTIDEWDRFIRGEMWPDGVEAGTIFTPILVDERGQSVERHEPVTG